MADKKKSRTLDEVAKPSDELLARLRSRGIDIDDENLSIDSDLIQAILLGKKIPQPREVILRDSPVVSIVDRIEPKEKETRVQTTPEESRALLELRRSVLRLERNLDALETGLRRAEAKLDSFDEDGVKV